MSLEINKQPQPETQQFLSESDEAELLRKLSETWTLGENARRPLKKRRKRIMKAYECQHEDITLKRNRSKAHLTWLYTAIHSAHTRFTNSLLPNDEDVFALDGQTEDDQAGCDMMDEYMKIVFEEMDFSDIISDAIFEGLFGETVVQLYWRKDVKQHTVAQVETDELGQPTGNINSVLEDDIVYNNVYAETIGYNDFIVYPVTGDISRATFGSRKWRHKDELMAVQEAGHYVNVEKIEENSNESLDADSETGTSDHQGLEVREFWISRIKIGGKVYKNMIATIVEDKYLIRFEPNPYDYGIKPFIYCPLIKNIDVEEGIQNTGHGIADKAYELLKVGNFILNQVLDESKIKLFGFYKYVQDDGFNPKSFISRPGGLVKVGDINNLQPVNPNINQLSFGITELEYLEHQFEVTTGVPKFLKGTNDYQPNETATAKRLAAEGSDTRFRALAMRYNNFLIKPFITMAYILIRQYAMTDPEVLMDIARRTQQSRITDPETGLERELTPVELIQQLPAIPPLSKMDVNVVGFENVLDKMDKANQLERFFAGVTQMAQHNPTLLHRIKDGLSLEHYGRYLSIDTALIRNDKEMTQYAAEQQNRELNRAAMIAQIQSRLPMAA